MVTNRLAVQLTEIEVWGLARRFFVAALCFLALACGDRAPPALSIFTPTTWTATEDLRIGSLDDPATTLTRVGTLAVDSAGRIYVSQPMDNTIRVFDSVGLNVGVIGRGGEGPGEFRSLIRIGLLGDTLYATDGEARRVTFFSLDGELLGTSALVPSDLGPGYLPRVAEWLAPDGTSLTYSAFTPDLMDPNKSVRFLFVHINRSGEVVDTAALWDLAPRQTIQLRGPAGPLTTPQPFLGPALPVSSADGSRIVMVEEGETGSRPTLHVTTVHSIQDTVWSREYAFDPIPVSALMVDSAVARKAAGLNQEAFPDRADAERQIRAGLAVPDYLPPVSSGLFSDDGGLWLRREEVPTHDQLWTVLDRTGTPVGQISLPRQVVVKVIRSNTLWGVETDSLGVPYVVRYTINKGSSGA